jgi:hypothetical protein
MPEKEMLISRNLWFYRWGTFILKKLVKALLEQIETIVVDTLKELESILSHKTNGCPSGVLAQLD